MAQPDHEGNHVAAMMALELQMPFLLGARLLLQGDIALPLEVCEHVVDAVLQEWRLLGGGSCGSGAEVSLLALALASIYRICRWCRHL